MFKKVAALVLGLAVTIGGMQLKTTNAYAWTQYTDSHYGNGFDSFDYDTMEASSWSNGGMFNCTWTPDNIGFQDGIMSLKIDSNGYGGYTGAEYRTQQAFGYGMFSVNMKPIKNPGVVSSFFTYTGPSDGTVWDEIDIEFLGMILQKYSLTIIQME